ncbi:hypothetical protein PanWU01x14_240900 [Parasponia andersonii]|uniref:Uncharacterized protein n=1 Tax=Parasponia andersonii TaxID=3476 RepID=A0A2P5BGL1_PARAD|nr:hypothetical protein PanWU01x14_240900 [Parasponia andersonii]
MGSWRGRRHGEIYDQESYRMKSERKKPPHEIWQSTVPLWEKKFCSSVGSVPWRKVLDSKKYMYLHHNVVEWNDSACEEAFNNAKRRFYAKINCLPCEISLPDPDIYIDNIDWNSEIDHELYLDLEREPKPSDVDNQTENVLILCDSLLPNQSFSTGWGDAEDCKEDTIIPLNPGADGKFPWEHDYDDTYEALRKKDWADNEKDWDNNLDGQQVDRESRPTWGTNSWRKDNSGWYNSGYRSSRFPGHDYQTDRGCRGRRRGGPVNVASYNRHALTQWNLKSCAPVNNHHGSGRGGNPWSWDKPGPVL